MRTAKLDPARGNLNKWEMYIALSGQDIGSVHIPFTRRLNHHWMVRVTDRHPVAYLKNTESWGGRDIFVLKRAGRHYRLCFQSGTVREYRSLYALLTDFPEFTDGTWIVQQGAPLTKFREQPFDIRVHLQRDLSDDWVVAGSLARVADKKSLVSNIGTGSGRVYPAEDVLGERFGAADAAMLLARACDIGRKICCVLDGYRDFNEIGVDFGVDAHRRLWLIEVNTDDALGGPSFELFEHLPDKSIVQAMKERYEQRQGQWLEWLLGGLNT